jgi:hypothetical protein
MNIVSIIRARIREMRLIGLTVVAACFAALPVLAKDRWITAKTEHFEVLSNANESEARVLVAKLEQFREGFLTIAPGKPFREPRTTVVIFNRDRDFTPYKPLYNGKPKENLVGVCSSQFDEVVIALSAERDLDRTITTIYHEYVHLLMSARGMQLPPWLSEGLAELYETMEFEGDKVMVGRHNPLHALMLSRGELMPLERLFAVTHRSPEYNESNRRGIFYAQSWAIVHYLITGQRKDKKPGEGFAEFIAWMSTGAPPEEVMQQVYGMSLEQMRENLDSHIRGGRYVLKTYQVPKIDFAARVKFQPATDFERDLILANLKWRLQRNGDATYQMMQLAEREPTSPRPQEVLAAVYGQSNERQMAIDHWKAAARLGTTNAYVYGLLAQDSLRQYMVGVKPSFRLKPEACAELREWLDRATTMSPDYAEAWDWLALTEAFAEKPRPSVVKVLQTKREVFGDRPRLLAGFAQIALRIDQTAFAEQLVEALLKRADVKRPSEQGNQVKGLSAQMNDARGHSWQRTEYYPEVLTIARAVRGEIKKLKAAQAKVAEPTDIVLPDVDQPRAGK